MHGTINHTADIHGLRQVGERGVALEVQGAPDRVRGSAFLTCAGNGSEHCSLSSPCEQSSDLSCR